MSEDRRGDFFDLHCCDDWMTWCDRNWSETSR